MRVSFLTPPSFSHRQPAERSAGCTRVVVPTPNIYELTLAATVRRDTGAEISLDDFTVGRSPYRQFATFAENHDCDIIFIWSVNLSYDDDIQALSILRRHNSRLPVIFAGPGPTWAPRRYLHDIFTYVLRAEPETTACALVRALDSTEENIQRIFSEKNNDHHARWRRSQFFESNILKITGLSWCDENGIVHDNPSRPPNDRLDDLPFPARDLIADRTYRNPKLKTGPYTTAFTSRNCPYHCIFCVPSSLSFAREIEHRNNHGCKPPVGFRSVESISMEMDQIALQGYRAVGFTDDNFIWNEQRTAAICSIMRRHKLIWGCQARADAITPAIAEMLARSGCRYIDLGVESFDDRILEYIKKGITADRIRQAIHDLADAGIQVKLNVLIGSSPLETTTTVGHTLREVRRLPVDQIMINIVSPFPGTEFHRLCMENGWIDGGRYIPTDVQRHSILRLPHLTPRQMERMLFRHNLRYFLSWRFISRQVVRFRSAADFIHALKALKIKLFG